MLQNLKRLIYGVPESTDTNAGRMAAERQQQAEQVLYKPESRLTEQEIHAVGADGSTWSPWRVSAIDGEQWYVRTSSLQGVAQSPAIAGELSADDFDDDEEADDLDPLESFRREVGIIDARYKRGEMCDDFEPDEIVADDDFGGHDDE